jgi:hypothetical protein
MYDKVRGDTTEAARRAASPRQVRSKLQRYMYYCSARSEGTVEQLCELVVTRLFLHCHHVIPYQGDASSLVRPNGGRIPSHWFEYPGTRHLLNLVGTYPDLNSQQANPILQPH